MGQLFFACILFSQISYGQLPDFTLQVVATPESCAANGALTFTVSNTTPGSVILYSIFHLPDVVTPVAVLSANSFSGLVSGDYRVIATESLGNLSNTQQQDVAILNTEINFNYTLSGTNEVCGNDGTITVNVTSGTGASYEIFLGPVTRPLQASALFSNLPSGTYTIRAFDQCGVGVARNFTVGDSVPGLYISEHHSQYSNCDNLQVFTTVSNLPGKIIVYPITFQATVVTPSGPSTVFTHTYANAGTILFNVPAIDGQSYNVVITDACGNTYIQNNLIIEIPPFEIILGTARQGYCNDYELRVSWSGGGSVMINFLSAPTGFDPLAFNPAHPGLFAGPTSYYNAAILLPEGTYTVQITNTCGRISTDTFNFVRSVEVGAVDYEVRLGCEQGKASLMIKGDKPLITAELIAAPSGYPFSLPQDLSNYSSGGRFEMNSLAPGNYTFTTVDICNGVRTITVPLQGYFSGPVIASVIDNCDSFRLNFQQTTNDQNHTNWLQKYYPASNEWGHPITGAVDTVVYNLTAMPINNGIYTIFSSGTFRIVKELRLFGNGATPAPPCFEEIYNFEYIIGPKITDVYSFSCQSNNYDAVVNATGSAPLIYRITTKNGQPFLINNNQSNAFSGLEPGTYNFQVEDRCGNILNREFDISTPFTFTITATAFCNGQPASLAVPAFSFLQYEWWKGNDLSTILSTTNTLNFASFDAAVDNGSYHVRIRNTANPNSCIDFVANYQIAVSTAAPQAGIGQSVQYCGNNGIVDLFSLLSGSYDANGIWQEVTNSGALTNNLWNSAVTASGNYQFKYIVTGLCNATAESVVSIELKALPETPIASSDQSVCEGRILHLFATQIPFGDYQWSGPNGFSATDQNPVIENISDLNNGNYTVMAISNGCESSASSVNVAVLPAPEFTLQKGCVNDKYLITASPISTSPNSESISYIWTGPENYYSSGNPINISGGKAGTYSVTATTAEGCWFTSETAVATTICGIPKGVSPNGDGDNDIFDLTGFDVSKLEIFSRYGRVVFEQENYTNQWHGQDFHNRELPDATYYFYLRLKSGEEKTGWVYVSK